ncbi:hypothetical protein Phum_PHUM547020 [Pediculus humanus corporis]|uniref:Uncharacterized protein n=1 Tax=Pediculus humanus subsp. corporis TaxID=121224 RepID=E0W085_PEDHC|nr:uncharacterized protein Phum_PHUM547020 [Pediculus humanus corporis]EEB19041.1 hypothetical protein Phum_PHUM547020 [Pediculus humanus corporis]
MLDNECISRKNILTFDEKLKVVDTINPIKDFKKFSFVWYFLHKSCYKITNLNEKQVVHLLFLLSKFKEVPKLMRFGIQDDLKNRIKYMNVNEVGIISFSLSKINIAPSNVELLLNINEKIMSEINDVKPEIIKAFSMINEFAR